MRKSFQLTLLLSCFLIFCSDNINTISNIDVLTIGHTLEENFNDTDNNDLDKTVAKTVLYTASISLADQNFFFERNSNNTLLTYGFIRAPPKHTA